VGPAWVRILVTATVGAGAAIVAAIVGRATSAPAAGWLTAAAVYLAWNWAVIAPMDAEQTAAHATREDPSLAASDLLILAGCVASLAAVALVLVNAGGGHVQDISALMAMATVAASWGVTHTVYTLRYAQVYYAGPVGGIDFNQHDRPRYADFAYLAFTIGMTYQVSDTSLLTPQIRAIAFRHALLSFLLGAVVLATIVNLVASLGATGG
jgi:uncharacterized membrane protein